MTGLMPFAYPPAFLLLIWPVGKLSFASALAAWVVCTSTIYFAVMRRIAPWPYTFAHPAAFSNALVGQNGFLTTALFGGGFMLLDRRPFLAGALCGLLVIKPQLAVLIPVALLSSGRWRAIGGAAASSVAILVLAWLAFGGDTYRQFLETAGHQATLVTGRIPWPKIASVFGALRTMGVSLVPALVVHAAVAAAATAVTWLAWRRNLATRVPIVAAASLLISPYLLNYDTLLMMIPIGWLVVHQRRPALVVLVWAIAAVAIAAVIPNPMPIAAMLLVAVMWQEGLRSEAAAEDRIEQNQGFAIGNS
jgi:hypothetical protein